MIVTIVDELQLAHITCYAQVCACERDWVAHMDSMGIPHYDHIGQYNYRCGRVVLTVTFEV